MSRLLAFPAALLGVLIIGILARLCWWILRGGSRVVIPWTNPRNPQGRSLSQRLRTRVGSHLTLRDPGYCALVFWKAPRGFLLLDLLTGAAGVRGVGADFSHTCANESWLITSHAIVAPRWSVDGPHFAPLSACYGPAQVRVNISSFIEVPRLLSDLEEFVYRPSIRHRGFDLPGYLLGLPGRNRVTCSGLIGGAILRQDTAPLARALRQALRERFTYGEITPADLARAVAILGMVPEGQTRPMITVPIVALGRLT